jgi:hypothetical protein
MTYTIKFSDTNKPNFTIAELKKDGPGSLDGCHTDLVLHGKGNSDYGEDLWNNLVHILENFSSAGPGPNNPIEGQLWYNDVDKVLSVYKEILPSTSPKTYHWSILLDVDSLSNPNVINGIINGLTAALANPSNPATATLLSALGGSYLPITGGTLTGPLNIYPYNTNADNDPLQNDQLAVSVAYLKSYINNKLTTLDLSTLIGFDIPPFDSTLDAGYGGYYLKKAIDSTNVDNSLAGAQLSQANIILPTYNPDIVNGKFAASRDYVDLKIKEYMQALVTKIIWTDTFDISNNKITGTLTAKLPSGFNYIASPTVVMSPTLSDAVMYANINPSNDVITISFSGTTTINKLVSKFSISSSQITGLGGNLASDSLYYTTNVISATPNTTTTITPTTSTTTAVASGTTSSTTIAPTTAVPTSTTTTSSVPVAVEGSYYFGSDVAYDYYYYPQNFSRMTYAQALAQADTIKTTNSLSYNLVIPTLSESNMLSTYIASHPVLPTGWSFGTGWWVVDMDSVNYWHKIFLWGPPASTTEFNPANGTAADNTIWPFYIRRKPK